MPTVADLAAAVIGGDTHADSHTLHLALPTGAPVASAQFPNTPGGHAAALAWIVEHAPPGLLVVGLEGTRSYGMALARSLTAAGLQVVEVERPSRADRRGRGKSDPIDARHAAHTVLGLNVDRLPQPRADGDREALRILLTARRELVGGRTRHTNQLIALLRGGDDTDRQLLGTTLNPAALQRLIGRRGRRTDTREQQVRRREATRLARSVQHATAELATNLAALVEILRDLAPTLTDRKGIGPVSAAQAVVSFSHPGRLHSEAAFAALAGAAPLPASSGRTTRHRLNRGGDRQLNRALHDIAKNRMIHDPRTRDYTARRRAQGLSDREIRRCLKRYIARELYRALTA